MHLPRLILQEILYRKLNFFLGMLSVAVAVGCSVGMLALLHGHSIRSERLVEAKAAAAAEMMSRLEDDFRKITLRMGYNTAILPSDQTLENYYSDRPIPRYMPEAYADELAARRVLTINHLAPVIQQRITWPEYSTPVYLTGVRGEVYLKQRLQKPLQEEIQRGEMMVGGELQQRLGLGVGQQVRFFNRQFTISRIRQRAGRQDDLGVWINLKDAQEILNRPNVITAILAIGCTCTGDRLAVIRNEVHQTLPGVQIIEFADIAAARIASRDRVALAALDAAGHERQAQSQLRDERQSFARLLIPIVIAAAVIWIAFLTLTNVRDRGVEIGILRAIGLRAWQVLGIFLGKAVVMGVVGAVAGYFAGMLVGLNWQGGQIAQTLKLVQPLWLGAALAGAPVLACIAASVPALLAARQDPADMLREE